jgi:hypothetical protein
MIMAAAVASVGQIGVEGGVRRREERIIGGSLRMVVLR